MECLCTRRWFAWVRQTRPTPLRGFPCRSACVLLCSLGMRPTHIDALTASLCPKVYIHRTATTHDACLKVQCRTTLHTFPFRCVVGVKPDPFFCLFHRSRFRSDNPHTHTQKDDLPPLVSRVGEDPPNQLFDGGFWRSRTCSSLSFRPVDPCSTWVVDVHQACA